MSITASKIPDETRIAVLSAYNGYCGAFECYDKATAIHHRISNSKANLRRFPLFLNSPINLIPICTKHHLDGRTLKRLTFTMKQADMMEEWLQNLKSKV